MTPKFWTTFVKDFLSYSRAERRAILVLLFILLTIILLPVFLPRHQSLDAEALDVLKNQVDSFKLNLNNALDNEKGRRELFVFDPNTADSVEFFRLGFSSAQIAVIMRYRLKGGVFRTSADFARLYVVSDTVFNQLKPYIRINTKPPTSKIKQIELNAADSIDLVKLQGIGGYYARKIIARRNKLGGFVNVNQLLEIYGIDEERLHQFKQQVWVDSLLVHKIAINTAKASDLRNHPYFDEPMVRGIVKFRKHQGKINAMSELISEKLITVQQADKLRAYIQF